jgi:hypothetical protein
MKIEVTKTSKETIEIEVPQYFEKYGMYYMIGEKGYIHVGENTLIYSGYNSTSDLTVADILNNTPTTEEEFYTAFHKVNNKMEEMLIITIDF